MPVKLSWKILRIGGHGAGTAGRRDVRRTEVLGWPHSLGPVARVGTPTFGRVSTSVDTMRSRIISRTTRSLRGHGQGSGGGGRPILVLYRHLCGRWRKCDQSHTLL